MLDDRQLLRRYVVDGSEAAFAELVTRYVNLVYSAALRRTGGNAHLAQDVAQLVFTDFARKARSLPADIVLAGWLHRATRYAAAQLLRTERRRAAREQEAVTMNALESETVPEWEQIRPMLDEALDELGAADRDVLILRFFEQRSLAEVGNALGSNEEAARKRVTRALEKLRAHLTRRGVMTSAVALSAALPIHAIQVAPVGLAATLTSTSLASAMAGTGTTLTLLKLMATTKLKTGIVSAVVVASVAISLVIQHQSQAKMREADASLQHQADQLSRLQAENERLSNLAAQTGAPNQLNDLLRLRGEVGLLRKQTNDLAMLQEENRQLQTSLLKARQDLRNTNSLPTIWSVEARAKSSYTRQLSLALMLYASENHDHFPTNFDQAAKFVAAETKGETNLTTSQFEVVYQGSQTALAKYARPGKIMLIREKQPWKNTDGNWVKVYVFSDGHGEMYSAADGNFEAWEKQHIILPESPKP